jgi:hypothetical protein
VIDSNHAHVWILSATTVQPYAEESEIPSRASLSRTPENPCGLGWYVGSDVRRTEIEKTPCLRFVAPVCRHSIDFTMHNLFAATDKKDVYRVSLRYVRYSRERATVRWADDGGYHHCVSQPVNCE